MLANHCYRRNIILLYVRPLCIADVTAQAMVVKMWNAKKINKNFIEMTGEDRNRKLL